MKRTIRLLAFCLLACAAILPARAQELYLGVRGGVGGGTIQIRPFRETKSVFGYPEYGIFLLYKGQGKYVDAIQAEVDYTTSAFRWLAKAKSDSSYTRVITSVEVPVMWHLNLNLLKERLSIFINLGPYVSYDLASTESWKGNENPESTWYNRTKKYEYDELIDNRFGFGIIGGGGVSYTIADRVRISVEARYRFGMSDIFKNPNKYPRSKNTQSQVSQYRFSLGVAYKFGKKKK